MRVLRVGEGFALINSAVFGMMTSTNTCATTCTGVPDILDPAMLYSILTSFAKLYPKRSSVEVLETHGADLLRRMADHDIPLEPVFFEEDSWSAPSSKQVKAGSTIYQKIASDYNDGLNPLDDPAQHF